MRMNQSSIQFVFFTRHKIYTRIALFYLVAVSTDMKIEEVMYFQWGICKSLTKMMALM